MKIIKKIDEKLKLPFHAGNWSVKKIQSAKSHEKAEKPFFYSSYVQTSMHRVEFFYKPLIRVILKRNEESSEDF